MHSNLVQYTARMAILDLITLMNTSSSNDFVYVQVVVSLWCAGLCSGPAAVDQPDEPEPAGEAVQSGPRTARQDTAGATALGESQGPATV